MTVIATILAAITAGLMLVKTLIELKTAQIKYTLEITSHKSATDTQAGDKDTAAKQRKKGFFSILPHPAVALLAMFSSLLTFYAIWYGGQNTVNSILLMTLFFITVQLVFLHIGINIVFRVSSDVIGMMASLTDVMRAHSIALREIVIESVDSAKTQHKLAGIVDRTLTQLEQDRNAEQVIDEPENPAC
ncbi:MAG TPA: hypothetical protein DDZ51_15585 [Planctomycetaceae bacterium]|nr:hypothetical protein [Planctomycetaceae bacterium]